MAETKPNIILVGLSGSGKTSIGRVVARELHWPFIDFDTEIEHREHATVQEIFERYGEPRFRELEQELTRELVTRNGMIMSAGGGWVLNREAVALLRQTGRIIYLRASPELLARRLATARVRRPLLDTTDPLDTLTTMYEARRSLYEEADLVIDTEVVDRKQLIEQVRLYALSQ
ncbi:MAG TPA: shikimate kinase [Gemmatimonadaceae bacterium]|nr:shikimate kinase [Gemmatimonadaceae bacterium]